MNRFCLSPAAVHRLVLIAAVTCPAWLAPGAASAQEVQAAQKASAVPDREVARVRRQLHRGELERAGRIIERRLGQEPDLVPMLVEKARWHVKRGAVVVDDAIAGARILEDEAEAAEAALVQALKVAPGDPEALNMLGHLQALTGRLDAAERALEPLADLDAPPFWLDYNRALVAALSGEVDRAAALLAPLTEKRPAEGDVDGWYRYGTSWALLRRLALAHPRLDPVPAVREGFMTRVPIEGLLAELDARADDEKPLIVAYSSSDDGCPYCTRQAPALDRAARLVADKYTILYTSVEPWNDVAAYPLVSYAYRVTGLPFTTMLLRHNSRWSSRGALPDDIGEKLLEAHAGIVAATPDPKRDMWSRERTLSTYLDGRVRGFVDDERPYRAFAAAHDARRWTWASAGSKPSQRLANEAALDDCASRAAELAIETPCRLLAIDAERVPPDADADAVAALTERMQIDATDEPLMCVHLIARGRHDEALPECLASAKRGNADAMRRVALMHLGGDIESGPDDERAFEWMLRSANAGHATSGWTVATMYADGRGVEADPEEALWWYAEAADRGSPDAQWEMAVRSETGRGVPRDARIALGWHERAAAGGDPRSQLALAERHASGDGTSRDAAEAYFWARLAESNGFVSDDPAHRSDALGKALSSAAREAVATRVEEWRPDR